MTAKPKATAQTRKVSSRKRDNNRTFYLASLIEHISDALISTDMELKILEWNAAAESMYGWTAAEVTGYRSTDLIQSEYGNTSREDVLKAVLEVGVWKGEITQRRKDGTRFPVMASMSLVRDARGKPIGFVTVNRDITERKQAEDKIAWLASFPEQNPNPVVEIGLMGNVVYVNPAARSKFPDLHIKGFDHAWLAGLDDVIVRFRREDISLLQREVRVENDWYSQPIHFVREAERLRVYGMDITERKRAEQQVIQIKRLYAVLSQVNQTIVRVRNRDELYQATCDVAVQFGEFSLAWIGLLDNASGEIRPAAATGLDMKNWPLPAVNARKGAYSHTLLATAIRTSEVVTSEALQTTSGLKNLYDEMEQYVQHSAAAIPFRLRGQTIGALSLVARDAGLFRASQEVHLLQEMGLDISFALDAIETEVRRKQTEQSLRESEQKFSTLFEKSSSAISLSSLPDGTIINVNEAFESIFGYTKREVIGKTSLELGINPDAEGRARVLAALNDGGSARNLEVVLHTKSGEARVFSVNVDILEIAGQKYILNTTRDITVHKRAEEQIAYKSYLLENVNDSILATDLQFRITSWNHAAEEMYGYKAEEVLGAKAQEIIHSDFNDKQRAEAVQALRERGAYRTEVLQYARDGRSIWVDGSTFVLKDPDGKISGYISINRDVTQRKQAEEQVRRQLKQLNALHQIDIAITASPDLYLTLGIVLQQVIEQLNVDASAVLLFDPNLQTVEYAASRGFHSNALEYTRLKLGEGFASQAVLERKTIHIPDLIATKSKLAHSLQAQKEAFVEYFGTPLIVKAEVKGVLELYHRSALQVDSEWFEFLETLAGQTAIAIDNAQLFESLQRTNAHLEQRVVMRTAELHQLNAELEQANRAKDEFLATMSHELRTPLTSILGLSESLLEQRQGALNEHQKISLEIIESSGNHLLGLINDILDLSKIDAGKFDFYPQPISVDETCRSSLAFIKAQALKKSITITYIPDHSVSRILADPRRLKQVLVNLLSNAVKFTPENGIVTLEVRADVEHDRIQLSVIDNGIGIAEKDLTRLFQPFVQLDSRLNRQHQGSGLGLVLVQKLADLQGGSIEVESEVGKGSRFTLNLAIHHEEMAKLDHPQPTVAPINMVGSRETAATSTKQTAHARILLAEDNLANILTIGEYLESHGYRVVVAHDGSEAIAKAEETKPDLILMDVQMPVLNGLEAIARLRQNPNFADTPIIALTALAMTGDRERCLVAGASEYMSKPVSLKTLWQTIENLLHNNSRD